MRSVSRLVFDAAVLPILLLGSLHALCETPEFVPLIPMPQSVHFTGATHLPSIVAIRTGTDKEDAFSARELEAELLLHAIRRGSQSAVTVELLRAGTPHARSILSQHAIEISGEMHEEGYALILDGNSIFDIADTSTGIFYGVQTLKQLLHGNGRETIIPKGVIRDWPSMKYRGQDDDLSRGPVPTLDYMKSQIRRFAAYKLNIYSPYFENTLQFDADTLPAPPGGTVTREEVAALVDYARLYHITVVPQQEAFGHLHHVLLDERYAQLAETPHGSVLAPGQPGSIELVERWYREIEQMFPGPFVHIGADETDDLGWGQTKQEVAGRGLGPVYIDFLKQIHKTLQPMHKRILFWGDVALRSPELVTSLPKDMIAVTWQYSLPEGDATFDRWIQPFREAGIETWVAPSANRGNRIYPENDNNLRTIQGFVADGQRLGATGMLNTVWDDGGEGLFEQNWYGVLFGAAASWQPAKSDIDQFQRSYGLLFHGDGTGAVDQAQRELMKAHLVLAKVGLSAKNALFWEDPWSKAGQRDSAKVLPVAHVLRIHAEEAIVLIQKARRQKGILNVDALDAMEVGARKMDFIGQKFQQAQEMLDEYKTMYALQRDTAKKETIDDISYLMSGNNGQCQDLRDGYGLIRDLFEAAWLKESRPYGLDNVAAQYQQSMDLWIKRGTAIREAANAFAQGDPLPPPEELGMPPAVSN